LENVRGKSKYVRSRSTPSLDHVYKRSSGVYGRKKGDGVGDSAHHGKRHGRSLLKSWYGRHRGGGGKVVFQEKKPQQGKGARKLIGD